LRGTRNEHLRIRADDVRGYKKHKVKDDRVIREV